MAPPPWDGVVESFSNSLVTPHTHNMPTGTVSGDRVIVLSFMGRNRTQGYTWNDSFLSLTGDSPGGTIYVQGGNNLEIAAAYRDMSGSPPASITATPSQTKGFVSWAGRVPAGTFDPATAPIITFEGGNPTTSEAPVLDPPWTEPTLFISGFIGEEFDFATYPLPDDQDMRNSGQAVGAVCTIGQNDGAALDLGPWAAFFDDVNGTILIAVKGAASGPNLAQLSEADSITVLTPSKAKAVAQVSQASAITALTVFKSQTLPILEINQALQDWAGSVKTKPLGDILVENDAVLPVGVTQILGQLLDTGAQILPIAGGVKSKPLGQLTATDALQALTATKALPLGLLTQLAELGDIGTQIYLGQLQQLSILMPLLGGSLPDDAHASSLRGLETPFRTSGLSCNWCASAGLSAGQVFASQGLQVGTSSRGLLQPLVSTGLEP